MQAWGFRDPWLSERQKEEILFSPTLRRRAAVTQMIWMLEDAAQLNISPWKGAAPCNNIQRGKSQGTCILESDDSSVVICRLQLALAIRKPDVKARADAIPQSKHARLEHHLRKGIKFPVFLG